MRQLTGQDATFVYMEAQGAHLHLSPLYIYDQSTAPDGKVRYKDILYNISARMRKSPVFRQRIHKLPLDVDFPYWVDDENFDLEFHVRHIALPSPKDWRQLCILVSRLHSHPLDLTHPPWEMYIIEGLDNVEGVPKGSFAVLSKYHHAAFDGASGTEIVAALHDLEPLSCTGEPIERWGPEPIPSDAELLVNATINNMRRPLRLASVIASSRPNLSELLLRNEQPSSTQKMPVPKTRFNFKVSPHRVFDGREFDLEEIRRIRMAIDTSTVNDVVLALCSGAIRLYLQDKNELPEEPLVAIVPINTRTEADADVTGNVVSGMMTPLQTHVAEPLRRLREINEITRAAKEMGNAVKARQMTDINQNLPAATLALAGRLVTTLGLAHRTKPIYNCMITNVPGMQVPLYQCGAQLLSTWGLGPVIDGAGLFLAVHSYNGKLFAQVTSCRDMMPDPGFFAECLQESFEELKAAAKQPAGQVRRRKTTP